GIEICGKDQQDVKRHFHLVAGGCGQVVDALFQWNDPAVEKFHGPHLLAAKVIDHEDAAVGLGLQGRFIKLGDGVVFQVQHSQRQFSTDYDCRAPDADIALVVHGALADNALDAFVAIIHLHTSMDDGIKDLDDLAIHFDGMWNENAVAHEARN